MFLYNNHIFINNYCIYVTANLYNQAIVYYLKLSGNTCIDNWHLIHITWKFHVIYILPDYMKWHVSKRQTYTDDIQVYMTYSQTIFGLIDNLSLIIDVRQHLLMKFIWQNLVFGRTGRSGSWTRIERNLFSHPETEPLHIYLESWLYSVFGI